MPLVALPLLLLRPALGLTALAALAAATVLLTAPRRRAALAADEDRHPALVALRRTTAACRGAALAAGAVAAVAVAGTGSLGRGAALAPAAFALAQLLGVLVADALTRDSARRPGRASLEVRRVRDYLPRPLTAVVGALAVTLLAELVWASAVAGPDDLGRPGRALVYRCASGCDGGAHTPWPGSYYAVPMGAGVAGAALLALLAVHVTVRRPRDGSDERLVRLDDAVRRRSVEAVVAAVGAAVAAALLGLALAAGAPVLADGHVPAALRAGAAVLVAAGLVALPVLTWSVVVLLVPGGATAGRRPDGSRVGAPA